MKPTAKQQLAMQYLTDRETEFIGYGGAAGGGKSILGCDWLQQMGYYAPNTKYFIGRDSLTETRESVLYTWRKLANARGFKDWDYSDNHIYFKNGSVVEFLDLSFYPQKDPMYERFGSKEYTSGWIEEAGSTHFMAYEVLKSRIGRWMNDEYNIKKKLLCTFNPKKNWVDSTFYRPFVKGEELPRTKFVYALPSDNPYLPADYIETLRNIKDKATRERLLNGNFDYDDDPTSMISYESIMALYTNSHVNSGDKVIICDVARFGADKALITVWDGFRLIEYHKFDISATTQIQTCINAMRSKHQVSARNTIVDEDGVGGGVVDNCHVTGFVNNSKPFNLNYANQKAECGYKLAEVIHQMYIACELSQEDKEHIEEELGQLKTYESDKDSKLKILPKEKIKDNIGRSPDWLDIFIMRMYPLVAVHQDKIYVPLKRNYKNF